MVKHRPSRNRMNAWPWLRATSLCVPVIGGLTGCGEARDEHLIEGPRLLAIRTQVVASYFDEVPTDPALPKKAQALPFETVRIEPYVTVPSGVLDNQLLDPIWLACELYPSQGLGSCLLGKLPLALDKVPYCGDVTTSLLELGEGAEISPSVPPCRIDLAASDPRYVGPIPEPEWQVPFSFNTLIGGSYEITMIAGVPGLLDTASCARPFLAKEYQLPDDCIYGLQRISVGPTARVNDLAEAAGLPVLPGAGGAADSDTSEPVAPDLNPRIFSFTATPRNSDDVRGVTTVLSPGMTIQANEGDVLELEVISPQEDLQRYELVTNNGESHESRYEAYDGRWFRSWGTLLNGESDDPVSRNEWVLEDDDPYPEPPQDGIATLWYVVRDGRQGVAWYHFNVMVTPKATE